MNLCYCCLLRLPQMDLKTPYIRLGVTEIFSEMIEECFKIHLFLDNDDECGICEVCVGRLQDASDFKLQVQRSQAELRSRLERKSLNLIHSKKFKKKYRLIDHLRKHNGQKPFSCDICNKNFTSNSSLWKHNHIHRGVAFICDHCGKKYTRRSDLVTHMNAHSENSPFKCDICGLQFVNKYVMGAHQAVHSEIKQFTCDVCGKQFRRKDHLATHKLTHSGQRPYSCGVCDQRFTTKANLKRHEVKVHAQRT